MNPVEIAALDALDLLVVVDNESDTLSSVDKGVPQLPELGRLVARVPRRYNTPSQQIEPPLSLSRANYAGIR
jgi:hypothetical protein